jgi:hypothetical protein
MTMRAENSSGHALKQSTNTHTVTRGHKHKYNGTAYYRIPVDPERREEREPTERREGNAVGTGTSSGLVGAGPGVGMGPTTGSTTRTGGGCGASQALTRRCLLRRTQLEPQRRAGSCSGGRRTGKGHTHSEKGLGSRIPPGLRPTCLAQPLVYLLDSW